LRRERIAYDYLPNIAASHLISEKRDVPYGTRRISSFYCYLILPFLPADAIIPGSLFYPAGSAGSLRQGAAEEMEG
jgi:hypothetical protein